MTYVPAFPKPARLKSPEYLAWVRKQPCVACGSRAQAHHTTTKGAGGSDYRVIPLCFRCHHDWHRKGAYWFTVNRYVDVDQEIIRLLESYIAGGRP